MSERLKGNNAIGGRFGSAIANVGDLNQDGYTGMLLNVYTKILITKYLNYVDFDKPFDTDKSCIGLRIFCMARFLRANFLKKKKIFRT